MHANRHSLAVFGMLGAVIFSSAPASAQCTDQWLPGDGLPGLNGEVNAAAVYDDGTGPALYVGGEFSVVGNVVASNIAKWDGTQWQPLGSGINDSVLALTVYNGELIAGGEFSIAGEVFANNIARWAGTTWSPLGGGMNAEVRALTVYNGELIAGGCFTTAGGTPAARIARWNGTIWSPLGSGVNGFVRGLTVYNGELIAGGGFSIAGGTPANKIARWTGTIWSPLSSGMDSWVFALTVYNGELIAGGDFYTAGGTPAIRIARWDGAAWSPLGSGVSHWVLALTEYNGELIAGGYFHTAGGTPANHIARWDGTTWAPLGSGMQEDPGATYVSALTEYNGELVAGGQFTTAGRMVVNSIARWDPGAPGQWSSLGSGMNGWPKALTGYNGELIAGGYFTTAGGTEVNSIARWDGATWSPMGKGMGGGLSHTDVHTLTEYDGELIAGGSFATAGETPANRIARWDGTNWSPLGSGMQGCTGKYCSPSVSSLAVYNGELIAGGSFTIAGETPAGRIARWNGTSWSPLGSGMQGCWGKYCAPTVAALAVYNGELIAGGVFTTAGRTPANFIARWDGTSWSPLGSGMWGEFEESPPVLALTVYNGELIAGGKFTEAGGTRVNYIARWDGTTWSPLGSGMNFIVSALTVYNGELIAGGGFSIAGGTPALKIARWDGATWSPLGSGMGGGPSHTDVHTLTVYNGELIAGGSFATAGETVSAYWARWGPVAPLGDLDGDCTVGVSDFLILLGNWGPCADCNACPADLDGDCTVGVSDFLILLGNWG